MLWLKWDLARKKREIQTLALKNNQNILHIFSRALAAIGFTPTEIINFLSTS